MFFSLSFDLNPIDKYALFYFCSGFDPCIYLRIADLGFHSMESDVYCVCFGFLAFGFCLINSFQILFISGIKALVDYFLLLL